MKRTSKKLKLDKQTIRQLDASHLHAAAGGTLINYQYQYNQQQFIYNGGNYGAPRPTVTDVQTGCPSETSQTGC